MCVRVNCHCVCVYMHVALALRRDIVTVEMEETPFPPCFPFSFHRKKEEDKMRLGNFCELGFGGGVSQSRAERNPHFLGDKLKII